jgi:hypothetical protein
MELDCRLNERKSKALIESYTMVYMQMDLGSPILI